MTKEKCPWHDTTLAEQRQVLDLFADDGHSVYDAAALSEHHNLRPEILAPFVRKQKSDGTYKGTTFDYNGQKIEPVAVYGLDVLQSLASHYHVSSSAMGRGFAARDLTRQIRAILDAEEVVS